MSPLRSRQTYFSVGHVEVEQFTDGSELLRIIFNDGDELSFVTGRAATAPAPEPTPVEYDYFERFAITDGTFVDRYRIPRNEETPVLVEIDGGWGESYRYSTRKNLNADRNVVPAEAPNA